MYEAAVSAVQEANAQLVDKLTKSAGFVIAICYYSVDEPTWPNLPLPMT